VDGRRARPAEALAPHADAIAERPSSILDKIKEVILRIDNDRAGLLLRWVRFATGTTRRPIVTSAERRIGDSDRCENVAVKPASRRCCARL
jgi:hypothetical protein